MNRTIRNLVVAAPLAAIAFTLVPVGAATAGPNGPNVIAIPQGGPDPQPGPKDFTIPKPKPEPEPPQDLAPNPPAGPQDDAPPPAPEPQPEKSTLPPKLSPTRRALLARSTAATVISPAPTPIS